MASVGPRVMPGSDSVGSVRRPKYAYRESSVRAGIDNRRSVLQFMGLSSYERNQMSYKSRRAVREQAQTINCESEHVEKFYGFRLPG